MFSKEEGGLGHKLLPLNVPTGGTGNLKQKVHLSSRTTLTHFATKKITAFVTSTQLGIDGLRTLILDSNPEQ